MHIALTANEELCLCSIASPYTTNRPHDDEIIGRLPQVR
jgi:hypothetical protein